MNVVLTGYSGFIGKNLLPKLIKTVDKVHLLGRKEHQVSNNNFSYFNINIEKEIHLSMQNMDVLIHCAGCSGAASDNSTSNLSEFIKVNYLLTKKLAEAAKENSVKRFIFLSTLKVNGEKTNGIDKFKHSDPYKPQGEYARSKALAEEYLWKLIKQSMTEIVIIRPPIVYGRGVKANFGKLIKLVKNAPVLPFGMITDNQRSFVYIENLVDLILKTIDHPAAANQIFLVSDDNDISTYRVIDLIARAMDTVCFQAKIPVSVIEYVGRLTGKSELVERFTASLAVDIEHTKNSLNWQPPFNTTQGITFSIRNTHIQHPL